ncbi:hypothetical protein [Microcoleus sp. B9-D4]|uniref:hypothetical protein n=2 Tax=unclassified Microcoleus TaxID=2642155 RepID=UPI002FD0E3CD
MVSRAGMSPMGINQAICAGVMGAWSVPLVAAEAAECDRGLRPGIAGRSRYFLNPQFSIKFCISNYKFITKKNSLVACGLGSLALYPLAAAMPKIVRATHTSWDVRTDSYR